VSANDVVLLEAMIEKDRQRSAPTMPVARYHTFFVAKQYLRQDFSPGHDDLLSGIVDGERDCGIDGLYLFVNSICLRDDTPLMGFGRRAHLDLVVVQAKNSAGFTEPPIDRLLLNLPKLLDFGRDEEDLARFVNPRLIEISRRFLDTYRALEMPQLRVTVVFASLKAQHIHPAIQMKSAELVSCLRQVFGGCTPQVQFLDAAALGELARRPISQTRTLTLAENPISTDTAGGYIGVVRLSDYEQFITSRSGELDAALFEANVRDYEGDTTVNREIEETLAAADSEVDFWWLNNGVTIVASKVQPANKTLELESPQIVNGLQTSTEIYKRRQVRHDTDRRSILVKVIEARNNDVRARIIRATNSQTAFGLSTLRATELVHRHIEEYLLAQNLFYERRRRYYFNLGKPVDRLVSIDEMGQAVLSVLVQTPHIARANPSQIFEKGTYELVFGKEHDVAMYYACIKILRAAGDYLMVSGDFDAAENFRYHLAMLLAMVLTGKEEPRPVDIIALRDRDFATTTARDLERLIRREYEAANKTKKILILDQLAKDKIVRDRILDAGRSYLRGDPVEVRAPRTTSRSASKATQPKAAPVAPSRSARS
jgi:hypothetical protein